MQNYHRHTSYSNIFTPDSAASNEDYAKRAVELGHKVISSVEHGWQGNYFQTFELAKKHNLKCVIGAEAYWVKDRTQSDKTNNHIIILAKNNNGREWINDILSEASISGYYYKPRVDLELLMSLPADDVFITSACIQFNGYEDSEDIICQLKEHFKNNFMLEIQYHNTDKQRAWNLCLKEWSNKYNIPLIVGLDSHYIYPEQAQERDYILDAKGTHYDDEEGWYMDYPSDEEILKRFLDQGVFEEDEIKTAMDNTDICLTFDDYDDVPIFNKDIKLPTIYPDLTKEEKDKKYSVLISKKFKEYMKNIPTEEYQRYFDGVKMEIQTYKDTGMVDYPLLDYAIVQDAIEHGGLITDTGRGSAVGYFTNTLCGFSKVDRFTSAIKLYPERFISTTRILETHSLPDIDLNVGTVSIFEDSQRRILGEEHVAPMIAFGTLKKKSAFKLYAKAQNMDFELANSISAQISEYDEAVKNAEEDEKDEINLFDYVDEVYRPYIEDSEKYWGVIMDKKKAPSAYLLYQGNIRREIGLIKCKSESTKKEVITCVIDGAVAENYKFLKNDLLKVDVVLLIEKVFKRIGIEHFNVNTLISKVKDDQSVWDIYAKGYTIGVNQIEKVGSRHKCMRYKPHNISELSAFVAAIRPGFKSMYSRFEAREDFSWGIPTLDNMISTKELPQPWILYQEQVMSVLNYAGFPMDQCYGIIKAIAKKHPEKVKPLKAQFLEGFKKQIMIDEGIDEETADGYSNDTWRIINDNCGYSFNSSHAYCMALDSLYQAWQKAHYPYEFYEVCLQHFTDKGNKDKVGELKKEMKKAFGISEGKYKFRLDNRSFSADKEHNCINPTLSSLKGFSIRVAEELYSLKDNQYDSWLDCYEDVMKTSVDKSQMDILIKLDYFSEFGHPSELLRQVELYDLIGTKKVLSKDKLEAKGIPIWIVSKYSNKETEKQFREFDARQIINGILLNQPAPRTKTTDRLKWQQEYLGYIDLTNSAVPNNFCYIAEINDNRVNLYRLCDGKSLVIKFRKKDWANNPFNAGNIIKILRVTDEPKWIKLGEDQWEQSTTETEKILKKWQTLVDKT